MRLPSGQVGFVDGADELELSPVAAALYQRAAALRGGVPANAPAATDTYDPALTALVDELLAAESWNLSLADWIHLLETAAEVADEEGI